MKLKAPFPWFGGKSRVAHEVWERFGRASTLVEPFAGSLAVTLYDPFDTPVVTVNDIDCYISNFWRATVFGEAQLLAELADWPVIECDLHARHRWLHAQTDFREKMRTDPHFFDAKIAAWWVWGISCWIGDNWCNPRENKSVPQLAMGAGYGINRRVLTHNQVPALSHETGIHKRSIRKLNLDEGKTPILAGAGGRIHKGLGINSDRCAHKLQLSGTGHGVGVHSDRCASLAEYFRQLKNKLRHVRVCCGDWTRVLKPSVTTGHGVAAIFLDPPYAADREKVYNHDSYKIAPAVRKWCQIHGHNPRMRIALCGYEGEHNKLEKLGWSKIAWKSMGGYGNQSGGKNDNRKLERVWFSPHCIGKGLFE